MYELNAYAVRKNGVTQVALTGYLPNSCYTAQVKDIYPGGGIFYITDPGTAQVFIEESMKPGSDICLMVLVPWAAHVTIPDSTYKQVTIFINGDTVLKVDVKEEPKDYRVIALTRFPEGILTGCSIIPSDAKFPNIYSSVFGPATKDECEQWRENNCGHCCA
ncbi:MAG: hypothetical protein JSR71_05375 [Proteobacteria bacterium]|nr:hypothetical protein [Pseudomonadota bacterium]